MTKHGVGIIGLSAERGWGVTAHLPALRALGDQLRIVGCANSARASAEAAGAKHGVHPFASVDELVRSPAVDIVAVTVKVPHHLELVSAALDAGKHVYCEWPLGISLAEAETLAAKAKERGVLGIVGTQARVAPEILHARKLVAEGFVGRVLSSTIVGSGGLWGAATDEANAYTADITKGATMLTIPFAHTLAAIQDVLGPLTGVAARLAKRRATTLVTETGETIPLTAHDQVLVHGVVDDGAPISIHYRGGMSRGTNFLWEINGTEGDLRISAAVGHTQLTPLTLEVAQHNAALAPIAVPADVFASLPFPAQNVARVYARLAEDLRDGTRTAPTFDDAVALHRLVATIEG